MKMYQIIPLPLPFEIESKAVLKKTTSASRALSALKSIASKYLNTLAADGLLNKVRIERSYYFINQPLYDLLANSRQDV